MSYSLYNFIDESKKTKTPLDIVKRISRITSSSLKYQDKNMPLTDLLDIMIKIIVWGDEVEDGRFDFTKAVNRIVKCDKKELETKYKNTLNTLKQEKAEWIFKGFVQNFDSIKEIIITKLKFANAFKDRLKNFCEELKKDLEDRQIEPKNLKELEQIANTLNGLVLLVIQNSNNLHGFKPSDLLKCVKDLSKKNISKSDKEECMNKIKKFAESKGPYHMEDGTFFALDQMIEGL